MQNKMKKKTNNQNSETKKEYQESEIYKTIR